MKEKDYHLDKPVVRRKRKEVQCIVCGTLMISHRSDRMTCSQRCRKAVSRQSERESEMMTRLNELAGLVRTIT